jgi:hypothetical protein
MNYQFVVARYGESIEWTRGLPHPVLIYNKGIFDIEGAERLPNIGFEAQTFLHHFADRYDDLAEVTICLQGDPFPHVRGGLAAIFQAIEPIPLERFTFLPLARWGDHQRPDGLPAHAGLGPANDRLWLEAKGHLPPNLWHSWYGGQFAVHRNLIHRHPREFWRRLSQLVITKEDACALERLWGHLML